MTDLLLRWLIAELGVLRVLRLPRVKMGNDVYFLGYDAIYKGDGTKL